MDAPPKMPAGPCSAMDCLNSPLPRATPHSWTSVWRAPWPRCRRGQQWQLTGHFRVPGLSWDMGEVLVVDGGGNVVVCAAGGGMMVVVVVVVVAVKCCKAIKRIICVVGQSIYSQFWTYGNEKPMKKHFFGHSYCQETFSWTVISAAIFKSHSGTAMSWQKPAQSRWPLTTWIYVFIIFILFKMNYFNLFHTISTLFHQCSTKLSLPCLTSF